MSYEDRVFNAILCQNEDKLKSLIIAVIPSSENRSYCMFLQGLRFVNDRWVVI